MPKGFSMPIRIIKIIHKNIAGHSHSQVKRTQIKTTILTSISIDHIRCHSLKLKILLCDTEGEDELFHQLKNILVKY